MKNIPLYNKTCDILFAAYFNDTLEHGNQCACAVGNMIAASLGIRLIKLYPNKASSVFPENYHYKDTTILNNGLWYNAMNNDCIEEKNLTPVIIKQIQSTGYSIEDIYKIERAFEKTKHGNGSTEEKMFTGLVSVLNVLKEIHEITEEQEPQLNRFSKHYESKLSITQ